ncbi:MAG TPA: T9SS type A sorting domain-containing protein [Bacteroidia bacterium]|nr:T9SS type A sorting domain-containing protein [Bacteroidia bacterium]
MRFFILLLGFLCSISAFAQNYYRLKNDIPVVSGGNTLLYPWAGGLNFGVFSAVDLDSDGLEDLFVYDRSNNRSMVFVNTGAGGLTAYRYAPEIAQALPPLRGWALFYDYNCDGKADLFTTGVSNNGIMQFRNDSQPGSILFTVVDSMMMADYGGGPPAGIFASGFLMPHFNDIDGDGDMDVLGQQFFCVGTFAYYKNLSMENYGVCDSLNKHVLQTYAWGNFALRSGAYPNVAVGQYHISCFQAVPPDDMFGYELAVQDDTYAGIYTIDIDDDGDMEALIGDSGARNSLMVFNNGTPFSADMDSQDTLFPSYNTPINMNSFTTHAFIDVDHDGVKDLIVGHNEFENKRGTLFYKNTGTNSLPVFDFINDSFLQADMIDVGEGAVPVFFDVDADGLLDLIIGNLKSADSTGIEAHGLTYFRNTGTLADPSFEYITDDYAGLSSFPLTGPLCPAFGDLDGDGDSDMLIGWQSGELYHFENTAGAGMPAIFNFVSASYFGIDVGNFSFPQLVDLNRDGKTDLVIGKKSGLIAYYENVGSAASPVFSAQPTKDTLGGINVQTIGYIDGYSVPFIFEQSGEYKMLVACMKGDIYRFGNIDGNILGNYLPEDTVISIYQGVKTTFNISVSGGDIDNDGHSDMLVGLYGGGMQIYVYDTVTAGINEISSEPLFRIYPNPASLSFRIQINNKKTLNNSFVRISDSFGRILKEKKLLSPSDEFSLQHLSPGLYLVSLIDGDQVSTQRIVKIH